MLAATQAGAQERTPGERQTLLELAQVLGETHALRQACDPDDQTWRARMQRMVEVEAPDQAFEAKLADRFNAGFAAGRARFSACAPAAAVAESEAAARGRKLAETLARSP